MSKRHQTLINYKARDSIRSSRAARKEVNSPADHRASPAAAQSFDGGVQHFKGIFETQPELAKINEDSSSGSDSNPSEDNFDLQDLNQLQIIAKKVSIDSKLKSYTNVISNKPSSNHFREIFNERRTEFPPLKIVDSIFISSRRSDRKSVNNRLASLDQKRSKEVNKGIATWIRYLTPTNRKEEYKSLILKAQRVSELPKMKNL